MRGQSFNSARALHKEDNLPRQRSKRIEALLVATSAMLLMLIAVPSIVQLSWSAIVFVVAYSIFVLFITFALRKTGDYTYDKLFAYGILIRMAIILAWSKFPPTDIVGWDQVTGVLYKDEAYYVATARVAINSNFLEWLSFDDPFERIAIYYSAIFSWLSADLIWGRLVNTLITALTSVVIYDSVTRSTSLRVHRTAWWVAGFAPELIIWSGIYLKEPLLVFGVAMLINSATIMVQGQRTGRLWWWIFGGISLCLFARGEVLILLIPVLAISFHGIKSSRANRRLFIVAGLGAVIAIFLITTFLLGVAQWFGRDPVYFERQFELSKTDDAEFPFLAIVSGWSGPLRIIGFALLLLINPVITGLWNLLPFLGNLSWMVVSQSAYAATWWLLLPLWPITFLGALKKHDGWWLLLSSVLILWIFVTASMRFGGGADALRYREAYLPLTILLAMRGLDYIYTESGNPRRWWMMLKLYAASVVGLILLRGIGVLSM